MNLEVKRNYLEINCLKDLKEAKQVHEDYSLTLLDPINFQLNKFFYKNIGNKHKWIDRLVWTEAQWIEYVSNKDVETYVFRNKKDLIGFFELIVHPKKKRNRNSIFWFTRRISK